MWFFFAFLESRAQDDVKFDTLITKAKQAIELAPSNADSCEVIARQLLKMVDSTSYSLGGYAHTALAEAYYYKQDFDHALSEYYEAIRFFTHTNDEKNLATNYNNAGLVHYFLGDYDKALSAYIQSLDLETSLDNTLGIAKAHHNIGMVFGKWERYDQQMEHYQQALALYKTLKEDESIAALTNNMGVMSAWLKQYDDALNYYRQAYFAYEKIGDEDRMAAVATNLGCLFVYKKENQRAIEYFMHSIEHFKQNGDKMSLISTYSNMGDAFMEIKDYRKAMEYYLLAEEENKHLGMLLPQKDNYHALYEVYKKMGQFEKALEVYESYVALKDSIFTVDKYQRLVDLEKKYHLEKSENELLLLRAKEERVELLLWGISLFFILSAGVVIVWFNFIKIKERQRRQIMEQKVLRTQMNPHFIFNALSALQCVILEEDQDEAVDFVSDFSVLMRLVLQYAKEETITIKKEKEILERYMRLQNRRFDNKFHYSMHVDASLLEDKVLVPPMLLQPFIENSIEHGRLCDRPDGKIKVAFSKRKDLLEMSVEDNGVGIDHSAPKSKQNHKSMAMKLTKERLCLLHPGKAKDMVLKVIDLSVEGGTGTKVVFSIPYQEMS